MPLKIPGVYSLIDETIAREQNKERLRRYIMSIQKIIIGPDGAQLKVNPDGTISVSIAGADSTGGAVNTSIKESQVIIPYDHQATLVNTTATHASILVPNANVNAQATWQPVPEGMSEFMQNMVADAAFATIWTSVYWSEDGATISGKTTTTVSASQAQTQKSSPSWLAVGGNFYKAEIYNGDAAPHTCSANIKFRP